MKRIRTTAVDIRTERLFILRSRGATVERWCDRCAAAVRMIALDEAALLGGTSERELARRVEEGALHFAESDSGRLLICIRSLLDITNNQGRGA